MLMALYSQCCPYVGIRQELRTASSHFFQPLFFTKGTFAEHTCYSILLHSHTWKLPSTTTIIYCWLRSSSTEGIGI